MKPFEPPTRLDSMRPIRTRASTYGVKLHRLTIPRTAVESVFWSFPHEMRRLLFRVARPRIYKSLQDLRNTTTDSGNSLKSYDDHRCIFVHIPKCAGVSVSNSLFGNRGGGHFTIRTYQVIFNKREFDSYFKFAFVRNPWDRLVSAYVFLKAGGFEERDRVWAERNLACFEDFDDFVKRWINRDNLFGSWNHFMPQHWYICGPDRKPLVDFVGRYEKLEADYSVIRRKLGTGSALSRENPTRGRVSDYREYYSEESMQIVADVYRADIQIFGYDFERNSEADRAK